MSALPPIATAKADFRKRSCPLCPQKQTCAVHSLMSAKGQKQTLATLFDPKMQLLRRGGQPPNLQNWVMLAAGGLGYFLSDSKSGVGSRLLFGLAGSREVGQ